MSEPVSNSRQPLAGRRGGIEVPQSRTIGRGRKSAGDSPRNARGSRMIHDRLAMSHRVSRGKFHVSGRAR